MSSNICFCTNTEHFACVIHAQIHGRIPFFLSIHIDLKSNNLFLESEQLKLIALLNKYTKYNMHVHIFDFFLKQMFIICSHIITITINN